MKKNKPKATVLIDKGGCHYNPEKIWVIQVSIRYPTLASDREVWTMWKKYKSEEALNQALEYYRNAGYSGGTMTSDGGKTYHSCVWYFRGGKLDYETYKVTVLN